MKKAEQAKGLAAQSRTWMAPETFRSIRRAAGLSANELAKKLRIADGRTIRHWEAGDRPITGPTSILMEMLQAGYRW